MQAGILQLVEEYKKKSNENGQYAGIGILIIVGFSDTYSIYSIYLQYILTVYSKCSIYLQYIK